jgi:hypothetical protein
VAARASVLVLVLAASAPARTNDDDVRTTALHTVRTGVEDALALEGNALKQWNAAVQKFVLLTPNELIQKLDADNAAMKATLIIGPHVVELDMGGAKSGGVTIQTQPDAAPNAPVDDIVEIKGDSRSPSTVEYFDEVM